MEATHVIAAILGSSVLSSLLTSWFGKINSDKSIRVVNVTQERKEWRDRLRVLVVITAEAFHAKKALPLKKVEAELIVRLNPEDKEDLEILKCFRRLYVNWEAGDHEQFNDRISYLLKHDWERVKQECATEINSQTLALASILATAWLVLVGCLLSMPHHFFYVGVCVMLFFASHATFNFFINNFSPKKTLGCKDIYYFCINRIPRKNYENRESRIKNQESRIKNQE